MPNPNDFSIRKLLLHHHNNDAQARKKLRAFLSNAEVGKLGKLLSDAATGVPRDVLGFGLGPELAHFASTNDSFFEALQELVISSTIPVDLRMVLLDILDKSNRGRPAGKQDAFLSKCRQVAAGDYETEAKFRAIRLLSRDDSAEAFQIVDTISGGDDWVLVSAAADTVRMWLRQKKAPARKIADNLIMRGKNNLKKLADYPGLFLLVIEDDKSGSVLTDTIKLAKEAAAIEKVVALAGLHLHAQHLPLILAHLEKGDASPLEDVVRGALQEKPQLLIELHKAQDYETYLRAIRLTPELETDAAGKKRLEKVFATLDLRRIMDLMGIIRPAGETIIHPEHCASSGTCASADASYGTGLQKGDAIYRDLAMSGVGNHWHAGLFYKFEGSGGLGHMRGLHVSKDIGSGSHWIKEFSVTGDFSSATQSVASTMRGLRDEFVAKFGGLRAIKTTPGISRALRDAVISVALILKSYDFGYTFVDMMDYKGLGWNGGYGDIDEMRCDGLVEFAYEKNGLKVCEGKNSAQWNITLSGKKHPENHNDLHNNSLNAGELCPKVQSGAEGTNSALITPAVEVPVIELFKVCCLTGGRRLRIEFMAAARMSNRMYVRIKVRSASGTVYRFLRSSAPGMVANWNLTKVSVDQIESIYWNGDTADGVSYHGQDGAFEFSIQVIDEGGNVSAEVCRTLDVHW